MIDGTYDISIDTPKHHKRGTVALKTNGDRIAARLKAGEDFDREFTGTCHDKDFVIEGDGEFPALGNMHYRAEGNAWGNSLSVDCKTDAGKIEIFGTRLSNDTGDFRSSHEYIMRATADDFRDDSVMYSGLWSDGG